MLILDVAMKVPPAQNSAMSQSISPASRSLSAFGIVCSPVNGRVSGRASIATLVPGVLRLIRLSSRVIVPSTALHSFFLRLLLTVSPSLRASFSDRPVKSITSCRYKLSEALRAQRLSRII